MHGESSVIVSDHADMHVCDEIITCSIYKLLYHPSRPNFHQRYYLRNDPAGHVKHKCKQAWWCLLSHPWRRHLKNSSSFSLISLLLLIPCAFGSHSLRCSFWAKKKTRKHEWWRFKGLPAALIARPSHTTWTKARRDQLASYLKEMELGSKAWSFIACSSHMQRIVEIVWTRQQCCRSSAIPSPKDQCIPLFFLKKIIATHTQ